MKSLIKYLIVPVLICILCLPAHAQTAIDPRTIRGAAMHWVIDSLHNDKDLSFPPSDTGRCHPDLSFSNPCLSFKIKDLGNNTYVVNSYGTNNGKPFYWEVKMQHVYGAYSLYLNWQPIYIKYDTQPIPFNN